MNMLLEEITKFKNRYKNKKVVIYGAGAIASQFIGSMQALGGVEIAYLVDGNPDLQGTVKHGYYVKSPYDLINENSDEIVIVLAVCALDEVKSILNSMGFIQDLHYTILGGVEHVDSENIFDPILGYTRFDDIEGFSFYKEENDGYRNILCLGGSTTDGTMSMIDSWPFLLQQLIDANDKKYRVINGGLSGYSSSQELLKLLRDGLYFNPAKVIVYSGYNDSGYSSLKHPLISNYLYNTINSINQLDNKSFGFEKNISASDAWIRNVRSMHGLCCEFNIEFYAFLQPCAHTGNYKLSPIEEKAFSTVYSLWNDDVKIRKAFFGEASEKSKDYYYIYDFTGIFDDKTDIFYDVCHCGEKGNQIIAERIYDIINQSEM